MEQHESFYVLPDVKPDTVVKLCSYDAQIEAVKCLRVQYSSESFASRQFFKLFIEHCRDQLETNFKSSHFPLLVNHQFAAF